MNLNASQLKAGARLLPSSIPKVDDSNGNAGWVDECNYGKTAYVHPVAVEFVTAILYGDHDLGPAAYFNLCMDAA